LEPVGIGYRFCLRIVLLRVAAALDAFAKDYPGKRIERILTVGGGMQMHGLLRYLRTGR
jgi:hypothetical protein